MFGIAKKKKKSLSFPQSSLQPPPYTLPPVLSYPPSVVGLNH